MTTMTMSAVVTTYLFGLLYFAATGIYFFYDSYIPIAVFLGMHLLFTDPSTSPRTELGRIIFGALYGLSTVALVPAAWQRGTADLLRQAAAGADPEPLDQADRSRGALEDASSVRSRGARPIARATPAPPGVHVDLGGRVCGHERRAGRGRQTIPASGCRSGSRPARRDGRMPVPTLPTCRSTSAIADRAGRATKPASFTSRFRDRARTCAGSILRARRFFRARVRARVCRRLPERQHVPPALAPLSERAAHARRLSDRPEGKQRGGHRPEPSALYALACHQGWPGTCGRAGEAGGR